MEIVLIAAMAANRVIGKEGKIPWHYPEELQIFKKKTMGFPLIMGRKTYDSIGHPLPGRKNIVLTRNSSFNCTGCLVAETFEQALALCTPAEKVFVLGGEEVFRQTLAIADHIELTVLDHDYDGDVFFPPIPSDTFVCKNSTPYPGQNFTIYSYSRKS